MWRKTALRAGLLLATISMLWACQGEEPQLPPVKNRLQVKIETESMNKDTMLPPEWEGIIEYRTMEDQLGMIKPVWKVLAELEEEKAQGEDPPPENAFTVQISTFSSLSQAQTGAAMFRRKKLDAFVQKLVVEEKTFYLVCVGRYSNEKDAKAAAVRLEENGLIQGYYIRKARKPIEPNEPDNAGGMDHFRGRTAPIA